MNDSGMADEDISLNVLDIRRGTTVDGPGFRTSIYLSGCNHRCPGCHNPDSWPFDGGVSMTLAEIMDVVREEEFNVTITGGDPLYQPEKIKKIVDAVTAERLTVWIYTGFTWDEIQADPAKMEAVAHAEAVVEGRFIMNLRDPDLPFRGSTNQKIVFPGRL